MTEHDRRLDRKLRTITESRYTPDDFVLADAKDADMGFGLTAAGIIDDAPEGMLGPGRYQTRERYLDAMRAQASHGVIDILLTSASNGERLATDGSLPDDVTLAMRANDTSDVWVGRGAGYATMPSRPFRTVDLAAVRPFCDLVCPRPAGHPARASMRKWPGAADRRRLGGRSDRASVESRQRRSDR